MYDDIPKYPNYRIEKSNQGPHVAECTIYKRGMDGWMYEILIREYFFGWGKSQERAFHQKVALTIVYFQPHPTTVGCIGADNTVKETPLNTSYLPK